VNPLYKLLGAAALVAALVYGLYLAEQHVEGQGYIRGVTFQKGEDQKVIDKVNKDLDDQRSQANLKYRQLSEAVILAQQATDAFKTQLEKAREINRNEVDTLRRKYNTASLRFATTSPTTGQGCGGRGDGPSGEAGPTTGAGGAVTVVQLPDKITGDLRQLVVDADRLRVEYATCYAYVNRPALTPAPEPEVEHQVLP